MSALLGLLRPAAMQLAEQGQLLASAARFSIALANLHTSPAQAMPFGKQQDKDTKVQWQALASQGMQSINPCNSKEHPAVRLGVLQAEGEEISVQEAYTPESSCFGCGPAHPDGLHLKSRRIANGLEATISIPAKYCAFPGIVNGGIISTVIDCHANWTAAIALMDKGCLPRPPLTLTKSLLVSYKEPTPPDQQLLVQSRVMTIKESQQPGVAKAQVEVETSVFLRSEGSAPKLLVQSNGIFTRLGALRAL